MTYKQLVVDLLCKKVSPLIITGVIVNQAHECEQKESFIVRLIKQAHPEAFVKLVTDRSASIRSQGLLGLQRMMTAMYVNKLVLVPRVSETVSKSLTDANLHFEEQSL